LGRALTYAVQDLGAEPMTFAEFRHAFVRGHSAARATA
jgi:hypothetical protein